MPLLTNRGLPGILGIVFGGCVFVGMLDGLQIGMQGLINDRSVPWPAVLFQASEWTIFGALTV